MNKTFINEKHLKNIDKLSKEFKENKPFEHISIENFLNEKIAKKLKEEVKKEDFYIEDHDLYQFERTFDLKNSTNKFIQEIREYLLSEETIKFIEKFTNTKLNKTKIDLHSLKLTDTHYLLCHDDNVQDRKVAFIINLSENWKKEFGGKLQLFSQKNGRAKEVVKEITPNFNQFNIFKVKEEKSYHGISEVIGSNERLSLSGWYYK